MDIYELKDLIEYNPITGIFTWNKSRPGVTKGSVAGFINQKGYKILKIKRKKFFASNIAWFYMTGEWPENQVDHINRIKNDDRWENLRKATVSQNGMNRVWKTTKSGITGVKWYSNRNSWKVSIMKNGKSYFLGWYKDFDIAVQKRKEAEKLYFGKIKNTK